jgi:hypothetical protein
VRSKFVLLISNKAHLPPPPPISSPSSLRTNQTLSAIATSATITW